MRYVAIVISLATLGACATAGDELACREPELSDSEVLEVVKAHVAQSGRAFEPERAEVRVTPEGCNYRVFVSAIPARPGAHWWMTVSRARKVLQVTPGA